MPIGLLNWELRDNGGDLGSDKGWLLTLLYLHSNPRGRCWPSMKRLAENAGCGLAKADNIVDWLEEHGAIIKVPYNKRELEEKDLHQRKTVYQLTGIVKLEKGWLAYLKLDHPEQINTFTALINAVADFSPVKDSIIKILTAKFLIIENSITESEGIESYEGIPRKAKGTTTPKLSRHEKRMAGDPLYAAAASVWQTDANGWLNNLTNMFRGKSKTGEWEKNNFAIDKLPTPETVISWGRDCGKYLPSKPESVQKSLYAYMAKAQPPPKVAPKGSPAPDGDQPPDDGHEYQKDAEGHWYRVVTVPPQFDMSPKKQAVGE